MRNDKNKILTTIFIILWILIFALVPVISTAIEKNNFKNSSSYISSDLQIENYSIQMSVDRDNKADITETFTVNIPENNELNGIYREISLWQKYYNNENELTRKKINITNVRAIGEKYFLNKTSDSIGIKIGSTKVKTDAGEHTYTIKYRYDMGNDENLNYDELMFNLFDNYGNTSISSMNIEIKMPEGIKDENINFIKGEENITSNVNYQIDGKVLTATIDNNLLNEPITFDMKLSNGYFVGTTSNYGFICLLICIAIIIISICTTVLWSKHGRDYEKKAQTVEFYPPDDMDCAQVAYIYGEKSIKKITAGLIVELASKGYITIKNGNDNKYTITKNKVDISKLKPMTISEQLVYQELFKHGDSNALSEDKTFAEVFPKLQITLAKTIEKAISDTKSRNTMIFTQLLLILSVFAWTKAYTSIKDLNPNYNWLYIVSFIALIVTGFFSSIMGRRTEYGEVLIAKVKGFRDFLNVAEKDRIKTLAEKDPDYFYKILPYAYVLGVSNEWIEKFDNKNVMYLDLDELDSYETGFFMAV